VGKLIFSQKNEYTGQFDEDEREGYGYYKWADGSRYKGWFHKGKQHGLGMYLKVDQDTNYRFGLWQMGKRLKWFSADECELIKQGSDCYISDFVGAEAEQLKWRALEQTRLLAVNQRCDTIRQVALGFHCPAWLKIEIDRINELAKSELPHSQPQKAIEGIVRHSFNTYKTLQTGPSKFNI
jgi:hypothetical protein